MIYADYNGSAPICDEVKEYLIKRLETGPYSNPNAIHRMGTKVLMGMENSRAVCAKVLGAKSSQCFFNSGSTESIATVFYSVLCGGPDCKKTSGRDIIITACMEHSAVLNTAMYYRDHHDFTLKIVPALDTGVVDMNVLRDWMNDYGDRVAMVSIMAANNETGVIQPYKEIAELCQQKGAPFFCDTTQIVGKAPFSFEECGADFACMSGHKVGALTGTGIVMAKDPTRLKPLIIGGGQEKGKRGGTQNYIGNETLAVALTAFENKLDKMEAIREARQIFENKLKEKYPEVVILGEAAPRLASTTYVAYPGIHGQAVQIELESQNIFVTTSSACSDNEPVTSKVLRCIGVDDAVGRGVVRISLGLCSPLEWYDEIFEALSKAYDKLKQVKSY